ncbi:MAG: ABC transporter substrate-binding protein, partial [Gaiella sp.]
VAPGTSGVVTIMHVDVEGSTALTATAGDEVGQTVLSGTKELVQERGEAAGGSLIDAVGDAMMFTFTSTRSAIGAAIGIQDALTEREAAGTGSTLRVRIGLNVGEVIGHDAAPFGAAVNAGARVMAMADGGEILVSEMVRRLAGTVPGVEYRDRGRHRFKGFDEPWQVFQVLWPGAPPPRARPRSPGRSTRWAIAGVAILGVLAAVLAVALLRGGSGGGSTEVAADSVARLAGGSGNIELAVPVGQRPGASAIGFGSLWVAQPDRGVVQRFDLEDGTARDTITVGASPAGVAVGAGSVWITNAGDGTVSRINPGVDEVTQTLPVGTSPAGVAFGDGALWVADALGAALVRVDPTTGARETIALAGRPVGVAFAPGAVWVTFEADGVARVDPARRRVTFTTTVGNGPTGVLAAYDSIWVANHIDGTVSRLEPSSGRVEAIVPVGAGPGSLASAGGRLWVASEFDDSVTAIDPESNAAAQVVPVGSAAASLAADGDELWLAVGASATEHRGGTLRVSSGDPRPQTLDPAVAYDPTSWQVLSIVGDGLTAYKKVGGPAGATLVPDLASALPQVSADGLTYRFPLRPGIRYSSGDPVRPEDFRRGLERAIALSEAAAQFFAALRGADECVKAKARCDLSRSIVTDAEAVTFRLARPDPDLPFKLALPFGFPVPVATPMRDLLLKPVPSTGPYVVARTGPSAIGLERNASFEVWSAAAQPDGFVDVIDWRFAEEPGAAFDRLAAGDVDVLASQPEPDDVAALRASSPGQVVLTTASNTMFVGMDVLRPPFDDVRVRRALNDAIDRGRVLELTGGQDRWQVSCQILPPSLQGFQPFCPYTVRPEAGVWSEPVPGRAAALVRQAGAAGTPVAVLAAELVPGAVAAMRHVVDVLNEIGLRARLEVVSDVDTYVDAIYRSCRGDYCTGGSVSGGAGSIAYPQVFLGGWFTDFPRASDFIEPQFRCGAPGNVTGYCNRRLDAAIDRAKTLSTTSPGAADRLWTAVEHQLVRDGVWAPILNAVLATAYSERTGNVQVHPQWGVLLSRVWVQ